MRRKSAGKKLMAVLIAASLALTPVELTVAAEMETEGAEATFLAEEVEILHPQIRKILQRRKQRSQMDQLLQRNRKPQIQTSQIPGTTYRRMRKQAQWSLVKKHQRVLQKRKIRRLRKRQWMQPKRWGICEREEEENAAFDDGTKDADVQASAEYSDGKFTWVLRREWNTDHYGK